MLTINKKTNKSPRIRVIQKLYGSLINPDEAIEYTKSQYKKFIKPSELAKMLELASLDIDDIRGVKLNPIDYSFSFSSMTKINYFMTSTKK